MRNARWYFFLGSLCGLFFMAAESQAVSSLVERSSTLCQGLQVKVQAIGTTKKVVDYAIDGAKKSCRQVSEAESRSQTLQLNQQAGKQAVSVGRDLQYLLPRVMYMAQLTGGAFDPTAWSKKKKTTYRDLWFDKVGQRAMIRRKGGELSFRGVLKGYLTDRIAARLKHQGVTRYSINLNNSVLKASGRGPGASWMIGIPDPHHQNSDSVCRVALVNRALATAADYSWYQGADSFPGTSTYASVSVLASDANLAEALANAAIVSGAQGPHLISRIPGAGAVFITHQGRLSIVGSVPAACMY